MGGRDHAGGVEALHPGSVIEDDPELLPVLLEFCLAERESGEPSHVCDVDIDGHQAGKCRGHGYRVRMSEGTRPLLAAIAVALLVVAATAYWWLDSAVTAGVALRTSFLCGALWLAWPELTQRSLRNVAIIGIGLLLVFLRPRAAWVIVPALLVWAGLRRR